MKVVFLQDVPKLARAGELKEVADGYGRNFLIPRKLALLAGSEAMKVVAKGLKEKIRSQAETESQLLEMAKELEGKEFVLEARAGETGRLYGSITSADISATIEGTSGLTVDKKKIELEEPIHQTGSYEIAIRLAKDIVPKIRVSVIEKSA